MKTRTFDATNSKYFKNQLEGKAPLSQIAAIVDFVDIIGDVFAFNYDSPKFLEGSKDERFELNCLHTGYHWFSTTLLKSLVESASTGQTFDWTKVAYYNEIGELSQDFDAFRVSTFGTVSLFDWYFAHDSMSGSIPEDFRWKALEIRDFLLSLLGAALAYEIEEEKRTNDNPSCDTNETGAVAYAVTRF